MRTTFLTIIGIILMLVSVTPSQASATRTLTADAIMSSDLTKTFTMPSLGGTLLNTASTIPVSQLATGTALSVSAGGTGFITATSHCVIVGAGTSALALVCPSTAGQVLTSNGGSADPSFQAASSAAPALNGGSASPQSVTAGGGISLSGLTFSNYVWITGSAGAVTVTNTPSITACTADGQHLNVIGTSASNTVHLQDQANLASSGLSLNGDWVGGKDSVLGLHCDITQGLWVEDFRR